MLQYEFTCDEFDQLFSGLLKRITYLRSVLSTLSPDKDTDTYDFYRKQLNICESLSDRFGCF